MRLAEGLGPNTSLVLEGLVAIDCKNRMWARRALVIDTSPRSVRAHAGAAAGPGPTRRTTESAGPWREDGV
jgi:hypothetical protein